ncbi:MAG: peroxiredoxin [Pseudomonadales bacterium]
MTIKVGDRLPSVAFKQMGPDGPVDVRDVSTEEVFRGKNVVLFGLPGAYTPVCSAEHLPGFVAQADALKAKGVDSVVCVSGSDPFVMQAWSEAQHAGDKVAMLSDHNGEFTRAVGLTLDLSDFGLGERSERYSLIAEDGVVTALHVEESILSCDVSGSDAVLAEVSKDAALAEA